MGKLCELAEWTYDRTGSSCIADNEFNLMRLKHHCRKCGKTICEFCSRNDVPTMVPGEKTRWCKKCIAEYPGIDAKDIDFDTVFQKCGKGICTCTKCVGLAEV